MHSWLKKKNFQQIKKKKEGAFKNLINVIHKPSSKLEDDIDIHDYVFSIGVGVLFLLVPSHDIFCPIWLSFILWLILQLKKFSRNNLRPRKMLSSSKEDSERLILLDYVGMEEYIWTHPLIYRIQSLRLYYPGHLKSWFCSPCKELSVSSLFFLLRWGLWRFHSKIRGCFPKFSLLHSWILTSVWLFFSFGCTAWYARS